MQFVPGQSCRDYLGCEQELSMNKIVEGLKEAVKVAKCDHELIPQPMIGHKPVLDKFYCTKCGATIYNPRPSYKRS